MMKQIAIILGSLATGAAALALALHASKTSNLDEPLAHTHSEFSFVVHAPMAVAAPLFGAEAERGWGGESWNPRFLYPQPASDIQGAVFRVKKGRHDSTWVATAQDFRGGHVQYVNVIDGVMATLIDIHISAPAANETAVTVLYERTALRSEANEHITAQASKDKAYGPEWASAIEDCLKASRKVSAAGKP
jgi:hypothetical protein